MKCTKCKSERIVSINAKCTDACEFREENSDQETTFKEVPENIFFGRGGYGDYINMSFCAECGQIQSKFPISQSVIKKAVTVE